MKLGNIGLVVALAATLLVGCSGEEEQATSTSEDIDTGIAYTSETLDMSYDDALDTTNQLILGTINLEETEDAITPEQAKAMLPLWQALQSGVTAQAEMSAIVKQVEGTMTREQLGAIAAMQLTQEDMRGWMEERGLNMGGGPGPGGMSEEEQENLRATMEAGGAGMPEGGGGPFGNMSEEERENMRATMEAGGMPEGRGGQFGNMSEEERENMRATMEAGGGEMPGRPGGGAGGRQFGPMLDPLIELLTRRAAE